nr:Mannosyl-oligosaccharide alpha-1,2-mannosidase 1B [Rachicladosporium sp. CCFEE 5018]
MRSLLVLAAISAYSGIATCLPWNSPPYHGWQSGKGGQGGQSESQSEARQRASAVKQAFQTAWDGYYKYAFPNDELYPVNNTFGNSRNGWGASALDALSTALIMENPTIVNEILDHIPTINWSVSYKDEPVSLFETTIRYVGGLLSGYDLLKGPLAYLCHDSAKVDVLLEQAVNLANNLSYAFDTPTGIPYNNLFFGNRSTNNATTNGLATIGTLVLEWTHLSDLSGDPTYAALTQKAESYLLNPQPATSEPWPGLLGSSVNISNGLFIDAYGGWGGGNDSFYEYLIKMYVYDSSRFGEYKDRWVLTADSSIAHLASHPASRPDLTFLAEFNGTNLTLQSGHLACFDGGNFIFGGMVLKQQEYIDFGLDLVAGCEDTYNSTLTGIGPEQFSWDTSSVPSNQSAFYDRAGFYIEDSQYILRPEVIESFYYAYRATGLRVYQDWAWNAFLAITKTTRVGSGYSEITDVNAPAGGNFTNFQDSFLFAEVLKYSYLIHAPDAEWQVNHDGKNEWVFNTEAHPFKVAGTPI